MAIKNHKHKFHALSCLWGPYGDQNAHYHVCITSDKECDRILVGDGPQCKGGAGQKHLRATLGDQTSIESALRRLRAPTPVPRT